MKPATLILKSGLGGSLLALAFNQNLWGLSLLSVAWLYRILCNRPFKQRLIAVLSYGFTFFALLLWWMRVLGIDTWLLLVTLCLASFAIMSLVPVTSDSRLSKFEFALCWVVMEFIRSNYPWGGFRWGLIGYSTSASDLTHYGRYFGGAGLALLLVLMATSLAEILKSRTIRRSLLFLVTLLIASVVPSGAHSGQMRFGIVQGGDIGSEVPDYARPGAVLRNQISQTVLNRTKLEGTDLVLWPENSVNLMSLNDSNAAQIQSVVDGETPNLNAELIGLNDLQLDYWRGKCLQDLHLVNPQAIRHF